MTRDESAHFHALALDLEATASAMKAMAPANGLIAQACAAAANIKNGAAERLQKTLVANLQPHLANDIALAEVMALLDRLAAAQAPVDVPADEAPAQLP
jgi:hypothetical protein